jgi:hypothetical protein
MAIVITTNDGETQKQETFTNKAEVFKNTVQPEPAAKVEKETKESVTEENDEGNTDKSLDYFDQSDDVEDSDDVLDTDEDDTEEDEEVEKQPKKNGFKKRIDKLTKEKSETKAENERLKAELERIKSGKTGNEPENKTEVAKPIDIKEPNLDDFEQYDQYLKAVAKYEVAVERETARQELEAKKIQEKAEEVLNTYKTRMEEAKKLYGSDRWEKVTGVDLPLTIAMREEILSSELGPHIVFYLANNGDECKEIAGLTPAQQIKRLTKIEQKLEGKIPQKGKTSEEAKISKAPDPVKPISSKTDGKTAKDPSKMNFKEFKQWRSSQNK